VRNQGRWIDISVPLRTGMVHWPGDPEPAFRRVSEIAKGEKANVTTCSMSAHTGTHMDAPCHFLDVEQGMDTFPLEVGIGPARVIEMPGTVGAIGWQELEPHGIRKGERILFKTRNSGRRWDNQEFDRAFVAVNASGAQFLAEAGVALVGIDYLSVALFERDGTETHQTLLAGGIWILEGLDLSRTAAGNYDLICLPLKIEGSDGAPARAVLRPC